MKSFEEFVNESESDASYTPREGSANMAMLRYIKRYGPANEPQFMDELVTGNPFRKGDGWSGKSISDGVRLLVAKGMLTRAKKMDPNTKRTVWYYSLTPKAIAVL